MAKRSSFIWLFSSLINLTSFAQLQGSKDSEETLKIVKQFFAAVKAQDTIAFKDLFLQNAFSYYVMDNHDSASVGGKFIFPNAFKNNRVVDEHIRTAGVKVEVNKRIAMVWVPYDLWLNQNFLYCGIDIFTLLKTNEGWKIASITFSAEKDECKQN